MSGAPPTVATLPDGPAGSYLLAVVSDVADLKARLAQLERSVPELAARLDGRFTSVEAQISRHGDHLAAQDQAAERTRLEQKSRDGLIQQRLDALTAAEEQRAEDAKDAERQRVTAAKVAEDNAQQRHQQAAGRLRLVVAGVATFLATQVWLLLAGWPLRWRLVALGSGALVALLWAGLDYVRSRPHRRGP